MLIANSEYSEQTLNFYLLTRNYIMDIVENKELNIWEALLPVFVLIGLLAFNPWLMLLLLIAVSPSFLGESHFNQRSYSLTQSWTPQRRELDYIRFVGASDTTAKEVKIFGLEDFLAARFERISDDSFFSKETVEKDFKTLFEK